MGLFRCFLSEEQKWKITDTVWLDILVGKYEEDNDDGIKLGRVTIGLYGNLVPRTVKNFIKLAENRTTWDAYKGSTFHRIEKGVLIQGGKTTGRDSTSVPGQSIYKKSFKDENFKLKHSKAGIVSMANAGQKNTNGTEFFITLKEMSVLDGTHVAFGEVVEGFEVVKKIEDLELYENSSMPRQKVKIQNCGRVPAQGKTQT